MAAIRVVQTGRKPWVGHKSEEEIRREALPKDKPSYMKWHFSAKRETFMRRKNAQSFINRDAMDETPQYLRSQKETFNKDAWLYRQEIDMAVQAVKPTSAGATQTPYYRRVTAAVQAEPTIVDARVEPGKEGEPVDPSMKKFFDKVLPRVMHHLTQNNEVPIHGDDYNLLTEDDTFVGTREEATLREMSNHSHQFTRDKHITSIDWRPGKFAVVVAVMAPHSMTERFETALNAECAVCIVWNFNEQANPQFILEAPAEVLTVKFCPTKPHIVVAGLVNGQVVLWDLAVEGETKTRHAKHGQARRPQQTGEEEVTAIPKFDAPVAGQTLEKSGDHDVWRLKPKYISRVEYSHRRAVHDINWLPSDVELNHDSKIVEAGEDGQCQFASIGEDGVMCVWDIRPANQPETKMKRLKGSKVPGDQPIWVPLHRVGLPRPEGNGELLGLRFHVECKDEEDQPVYMMACTSVEGEFASVYWGPKEEASQANQGGFDDGRRKEQKIVRSIACAHAGPAWGVQRHPTLRDYYLTVGDWGFKVWCVGLPAPILASPLGDVQVMCGRWSPSRPAVLLIGTRDGHVQVWDLLDRSHEKLFDTAVGTDPITVLEFKPTTERRVKDGAAAQASAASQQHLVVGSAKGYFQLFELPRKLVRAHPSEHRLARSFFEREARRVAYFNWRWKERSKEMDALLQDRAESKGNKDMDDENRDEEADYTMTQDDDSEFFALVDKLSGEAGDALGGDGSGSS